MEASTKYNRYAAKIPKGMKVGGGLLVAYVLTSRGGGILPNSDPFGQTEKGGREERVQKLDIFHGYHKWMVPNVIFKSYFVSR